MVALVPITTTIHIFLMLSLHFEAEICMQCNRGNKKFCQRFM